MNFVHLHAHSNFSFYDGAAPVDELARAARDRGMSAIALTDHNSLAGAVRFFQAATEVGVRPIIGVEFTVEPVLPDLLEDSARPPHLLLLAEDNEGYSNLCRLVTAARLGEARRESAFSAAYEDVDRDNPVLSQENLRRHSDHLIALTACRKRGEIPSLLDRKRFSEARAVAEHYRDLFGPERLFIELHNHLLPRPHSRLRYRLADLAARLELECVATNNVHYVEKSLYRLQDVMVCMGARQTVDEPNPDRRPNAEFYLKDPHQMAELFADQPEAVENAARIAQRCQWELDLETFHFPAFDMDELREHCRRGGEGGNGEAAIGNREAPGRRTAPSFSRRSGFQPDHEQRCSSRRSGFQPDSFWRGTGPRPTTATTDNGGRARKPTPPYDATATTDDNGWRGTGPRPTTATTDDNGGRAGKPPAPYGITAPDAGRLPLPCRMEGPDHRPARRSLHYGRRAPSPARGPQARCNLRRRHGGNDKRQTAGRAGQPTPPYDATATTDDNGWRGTGPRPTTATTDDNGGRAGKPPAPYGITAPDAGRLPLPCRMEGPDHRPARRSLHYGRRAPSPARGPQARCNLRRRHGGNDKRQTAGRAGQPTPPYDATVTADDDGGRGTGPRPTTATTDDNGGRAGKPAPPYDITAADDGNGRRGCARSASATGVCTANSPRSRSDLPGPRPTTETASPAAVSYPPPREGEGTRQYLRRLCYHGAARLYGHVTGQVRERLEHELSIIEDKGLSDYFLIVWDIVRFAREQGIRCSGRGSAGDSIVSYVLGITLADPIANDLLFERFLNPKRRNMPDIDVDFDTRRRDEVTKYIYDKYGAEQVAAVCTVNTFRARSAIREIGKALGFPEEEIGKLASVFPHIRAADIAEAIEKYPEVRDAELDVEDKRLLIELCREISGFPRHLSVHVGGLLIGARPLTEMVPLELANKGIVIAQFDKDDVEALGLVKMDILGLRIHSAIEDALDHIEGREGVRPDLDALPLDDEPTYQLLRGTRTVGLFQLESPGQRNLLGRTQPTEFEDIVANISLFRPGPVQADMITPYVLRKHGLQQVTYPHPDLEPILQSTFGVVIYQEQVLRIAHAIGGFSLGEADVLRRMMTSDIAPEDLEELQERFMLRAGERGIRPEVAEEIFGMIRGFAAYGFNKAHAACFGKMSYQTAWLKAHYPAELAAGILSSQPMGFYPPRTVAEDAKRCGAGILPPCVNRSEDRCLVEYDDNPTGDIRLGLWMVRGLQERSVERILAERERGGAFASLEDFCRRTSIPRPAVENLVLARAFAFTGLNVPELMWRLGALPDDAVADRRGRRSSPTLSYGDVDDLVGMLPSLDPMTEVGRVATDLHVLGVSTTRNAFSFWRERLDEMEVTSSTGLWECEDGDRVRVAGIVVSRARPPTRSGRTAIFISLEDDVGLVDVAVFEEAYQECGRALYTSPVLCVEGTLTRMGKLDLSVTAERVIGLGSWQDFRLAPVGDKSLGSAAHRNERILRQTPARGGERRQIAYY
ncbi:MAG: DNA polymerase III subunit alpha [Armatimonadota bacterium]|nr:DNA polymerase III subunit alpha [Armatimonadota bacterium]